MIKSVYFDDSLPILARAVKDELGGEALSEGVVLRDATGRLAFFSSQALPKNKIAKLSKRLKEELGPYARSDRVVACAGEFGVDEILQERATLRVTVDSVTIRILDRRLVGADWLRTPAPLAPPPPRFVFSSLKGGVGRSTALAVAAADFASRGRRVLLIDLDMEAPGLGAMLLDDGTIPEFGLIDALVENGLAPLDDKFLADLVGPSALSDRSGRIDVIPAFGRRSIRYSGDVLAKIARAYAEDVRPNGTVATILDQVRAIVDKFAESRRYDAILVDSRAGLHETTASAILGLGANIFLFGLNERQTFQGYAALFSHLKRFIDPGKPLPEWIERLTMVQGKASSDIDDRKSFQESCERLFAELGFAPKRSKNKIPLPAAPFKDVPWDDSISDAELDLDFGEASREPITIFDDERFRLFDPALRRNLLTEKIYKVSFGPLLDRMNEAFV